MWSENQYFENNYSLDVDIEHIYVFTAILLILKG